MAIAFILNYIFLEYTTLIGRYYNKRHVYAYFLQVLNIYTLEINNNKRNKYYTTSNSSQSILVKKYSNSEIFNGEELHPLFVTGFTDAEGSFMMIFSKSSESRYGYRIRPIFQIELHKKDINILKNIKKFFGDIGFITEGAKNSMAFRIRSLSDLSKIISHFDKYPLKTKKRADYELFKTAVCKLVDKHHLKLKGYQEIVNIRASMNLGLTDNLKKSFPKTVPVYRPLIQDEKLNHPL